MSHLQARTNFELHFENCKNHIRGVISSYENLLETINFRKQQHKIARQLSRFGRTNSALDGDSWNPDDGKKKASPVSNEEQNQMDTAESGFGFGFGSSSSSSFGSGFFGFGTSLAPPPCHAFYGTPLVDLRTIQVGQGKNEPILN